jgi:hypothetical protein
MKAGLRFAVAAVACAMWPVTGVAQQTKVVSVCEVMANPEQYGNSVVAVVGRLDATGIVWDRRNFVSEDQCEKPVSTNGYAWPGKILIWTQREKGLPDAPSKRPQFDRRALADKIASMSKSTDLGSRREFQVDKQGDLKDTVVKNQWVVAYGHTFYSPNLTNTGACKGFGCDGFNGNAPIVIVVDPKNVRALNEDGSFAQPSGK